MSEVQDGTPYSLATSVPWHDRVLTLQPGPNLQKSFGNEDSSSTQSRSHPTAYQHPGSMVAGKRK